ncbi:hypothetical protein V6N13_051425 [Hibiscus sabdariffa]
MLSIFLFFFLALLRRLFPTAFDFWCKHAIRHCFQSTFFTTNGSESVLPPLAVVFCAAMKEGSSRVSSLALLNPGFGIYGRRSQTVQGLVMLFLAATWFPLRDAYRISSQTWHFLRIPAYLRNLLIGIEHMLSPFISLYLEAILSASFCCVMDPELMSALENLQFTEEEATAVVAESPIEDGDSSSWLVRSVITRKPVNGDSVVRIFRSVWKAKNILDIVELRPNFFLIKPSTLDAKDMILKRRPWASHDEFFSIMSYNPAWRIEEYDFQLMTIWIRVYRLPLRAMTRDMGIRLGGCVGKVLGVDHRVEGGNMGDFLRILVQVDIRKPLRRCVLLGDSAGKEASPRPLCYERLPEFCYFCGLVGHSLSSCTAKPADLDARKLQYGSWLRGSITDEAETTFLDAKREHKSLLDKDEAYWAQRARVTWLTQGDRNSAYFHARASGRRKKNRIRGLFDESGIWTDKQAKVAGVAMRYFTTLFSSSQPTPNSSLLSNIDHCISSDDNTFLLRPFIDAEIFARRARKRLGGDANDSITKFPISGKVPLEWLMHRSASLSPGHAQSVGGVRDPYLANHSRLWSC